MSSTSGLEYCRLFVESSRAEYLVVLGYSSSSRLRDFPRNLKKIQKFLIFLAIFSPKKTWFLSLRNKDFWGKNWKKMLKKPQKIPIFSIFHIFLIKVEYSSILGRVSSTTEYWKVESNRVWVAQKISSSSTQVVEYSMNHYVTYASHASSTQQILVVVLRVILLWNKLRK